jgi:hypothetical protein
LFILRRIFYQHGLIPLLFNAIKQNRVAGSSSRRKVRVPSRRKGELILKGIEVLLSTRLELGILKDGILNFMLLTLLLQDVLDRDGFLAVF